MRRLLRVEAGLLDEFLPAQNGSSSWLGAETSIKF
jgi:hypothetical protein